MTKLMTSADAKALYEQEWVLSFTTMEVLSERIAALARNGAYHTCVCVDGQREREDVREQLTARGFDVDDYNGGNSGGILEVSWG